MKSNSITDQVALVSIIIRNAKRHAGIQQKLTEWGYPAQQLTRGETLLATAQMALQTQRDCYDTKLETTRRWKEESTELRRRYAEHRAVAKTIFRDQPDTLQRLRLKEPLPRRRSNLFTQMQHFYQGIITHSKEMQKLGIKADDLTQTQTMVSLVQTLQADRLQKKGDAESATQKRDKTLAELRTWRQEFIRVAKMALKDDPQLLEVLGITVPA